MSGNYLTDLISRTQKPFFKSSVFCIGGKVSHLTNSNLESYLVGAIPCVMALVYFDGVHFGHQAVIIQKKSCG